MRFFRPVSRLVVTLVAPIGASLVFWWWFAALGGCAEATATPEPPPQVWLDAHWDPLACGEPHRVVVALEDEAGAPLGDSAPCERGGVTLAASHFGRYRGRVFAWADGEPPRSATEVVVDLDAAVVEWDIATPE